MLLLLLSAASVVAMPPAGHLPADPMQQLLERMVADDPGRGDCWRMLAKLYRRQHRIDDSIAAFQRALAIQPDSVAAHADFADLWAELGERQRADYHYNRVMQLAPSSSYADQLVRRGIRARPVSHTFPAIAPTIPPGSFAPSSPSQRQDIDLVGYEIQTG